MANTRKLIPARLRRNAGVRQHRPIRRRGLRYALAALGLLGAVHAAEAQTMDVRVGFADGQVQTIEVDHGATPDELWADAERTADLHGSDLLYLQPYAREFGAVPLDARAICQHVAEEVPTDRMVIHGPFNLVIECPGDIDAQPMRLTLASVADVLDWQFNHGQRVVIDGEEDAERPSIEYWRGLKMAKLDENAVVAPLAVIPNPFK